ncbi:MAG: hypothetical protein LUD27_01590 [Clostridia bacterium]|nr:hypothetical protein [Clostridia bacterium]
MAEKNRENEQQQEEQEEVRKVRHTISTEETFTLAKDVYDLRSFIKKIYRNRAVIAHRLNIFSLVCSLIFTLVYVAYSIWNIAGGMLSEGQRLAFYILLGIYVLFAAVFIIVTVCSNRANTKSLKKFTKSLKYLRLGIRLISIAMAIVGIVISSADGEDAVNIALRIILVVVSIISIVIQSIPLIFGGIVRLVRWTMKPSKGKVRFSAVLLEWYGLIQSGNSDKNSVRKVSKTYKEDIGKCIDGYLIPRLGKKKITDIDAAAIYSATDEYSADKDIIEGIFKSVFSYAEECGYVNFNPTKDMDMEGSIEVEEKKVRKTIKGGIANIGKKIGKSVVNKFLGDDEN